MTYRIRLSIGFKLTSAIRRMPHVEQDLLSLLVDLRSPLVFSGVCVVFYIVYCCLTFSFLAMSLSVYFRLFSLNVSFVLFASLLQTTSQLLFWLICQNYLGKVSQLRSWIIILKKILIYLNFKYLDNLWILSISSSMTFYVCVVCFKNENHQNHFYSR